MIGGLVLACRGRSGTRGFVERLGWGLSDLI